MDDRSPISLRAAWILALGTVVAAVGTSAVVVTALSGRTPVSTAMEPGSTTTGAGELAGELARLRATLERIEEARALTPAAPAPSGEGRLVIDEQSGVAMDRFEAAVMRLENVLRQELESTRAMLASAERAAVAARRVEVDWEAWNELYEIYQLDEEEARKQVQLLTTDQVLARYGPPKYVSQREGHNMWYYSGEDAGQPVNVTIRILDGYVTGFWMEL